MMRIIRRGSGIESENEVGMNSDLPAIARVEFGSEVRKKVHVVLKICA
jgi:hypothetical protein